LRATPKMNGAARRQRYLDGLQEKFKALLLPPRTAAERPDFEPPVRIIPFRKHLIVYVIDDGGILILRVLHQPMDVPEMMRGF
jgi:toxin ParE1/3/4